jgi:hypothetical protein
MSAFSLACQYQNLIVEQSASASKTLKKRKEVKMKDKQQNLENLDFLTELTLSEQEEINGGAGKDPGFTSPSNPPIVGLPGSLSPITELPPDDDETIYKQPFPRTITAKITI